MAEVTRFDTKYYDGVKPSRFSFFKIFTYILLGIVILGVGYSFTQYLNYKNFLQSDPSLTQTKSFEVKPGESLESISERLVQEGIFKDENIFTMPAYKWYLKLNPINSDNIQAGIHEIPANASPDEVFANLKAQGCKEVQVTLREGWRVEEFAEELGKVFFKQQSNNNDNKVVFNQNEFLTLVKNYNGNASNLSFAPPVNLEGYLFPDTYRFCSDIKTDEVVKKLLENFNSKVILALKDEFSQNRFDLPTIINIASMVEREGRQYETKRNIADVIIKRLDNEIPLGIDATTQYEFGYSESQKSWWRQGDELDIVIDTEHFYNTRKNAGLPPTPIANPGLDSIKSVLNPNSNPYFYYITDEAGNIYYAETQNEHDYNVCKYLYGTCE